MKVLKANFGFNTPGCLSFVKLLNLSSQRQSERYRTSLRDKSPLPAIQMYFLCHFFSLRFTPLYVPYVLCIPPNCFSLLFFLVTHSSFLLFHVCIYGFLKSHFFSSVFFLLASSLCCLVVAVFCAWLYDASIKSYRVLLCAAFARQWNIETFGMCGMD